MTIHLLNSDARCIPLADRSVQCIVTSPIYWRQRDYGIHGQLGLETTPEDYVSNLMVVMRECYRVLKPDGVIWMVIGDTMKNKNLIGIPWLVAFAMKQAGYYLRSECIWHKTNAKPGSQTDRPTTGHENIFLFSKRKRYYYDNEAIKEPAKTWTGRAATFERNGAVAEHIIPGQGYAEHRPNRNGANSLRSVGRDRATESGKSNRAGRDMAQVCIGPTRTKRSVWSVATVPYREAHFATFPPKLVEPMILAGSRPGDIVLDPFCGTAVVGQVCRQHHREFIGIELNPFSIGLAIKRLQL